MKYSVAICDDSATDIQCVQNMLMCWCAATNHDVQVNTFASAEDFLFHYADKNDYDILLLDIEMGTMNGVEMARRLRKENDTVQIVFITGYSDYIAEGYEVDALHYLMKPVKEEKLFAVLNRATEKLAKNEKTIFCEHGGEMVRIPIYKIRYVDVMGNYTTVHAHTDFTIKMPLHELEKELDERFYRVGRSAVVNLTKISRVTKTEIKLDDGSVVPIPRGAYEGVNRAIILMK